LKFVTNKKFAVMSGRVRGTIKWWNETKGFGFIVQNEVLDGADVFFHSSACNGALDKWSLTEGMEVEFFIAQGQKGPAADQMTRPGEYH
jgi:CspA family cold shock protein